MEIVVFGAGGFAREVHGLLEDINDIRPTYDVLGFLDGNPAQHGQKVHDLPVLGGMDWLATRPDAQVVIGIGNPAIKRRCALALERLGVASPVLVHPQAVVGRRVELGSGTIVCAGTIATTEVRLGRHVILNLDCTVGHDVALEDFVTVAPGVHISGNVTVGEGCDLGTGSSIIQGTHVGAWGVVGAGAVVNKDLPPNVTAVGVPAKVIKEREQGWHLQ